MSKKKRNPCRGPNLSYYELCMPPHTFLKHQDRNCRGTIILPVSSRDPDRVIGRAHCRKCGAVVGRKALRRIWKAVGRGSYVPQLLPAVEGGQGLCFRHHKVSPAEALEASFAPPEPVARMKAYWSKRKAVTKRPRAAWPDRKGLWGDTLDVAMEATTEAGQRAAKKIREFKAIWDVLEELPLPKDDL